MRARKLLYFKEIQQLYWKQVKEKIVNDGDNVTAASQKRRNFLRTYGRREGVNGW
jgi:hypothetical protein